MNDTTKLIAIALGSSLCMTLCSCGDKKQEDSKKTKAKEQQAAKTHDSISKESLEVMGKMSDTLAKIKNLDSAGIALPELTQIAYKIERIKTDSEKLGQPSENVAARLKKEYGTQMKTIVTKISQTMTSLKTSSPEAYGMIKNVMKTIME